MAAQNVTAKVIGGMVPAPFFGEVAPPMEAPALRNYGDVPLRAFGDDKGTGAAGDQNLTLKAGGPSALTAADNQTPTPPVAAPEPAPTTPVPTTPPTTPPTVPPVDADHRKWYSIGDPHVRMGGEKFDDSHAGDYVLLQSADKSYQVNNRKEKFADGSVANTAVAVKDGDNVVSYDVKTKKLKVNGKEWDGKTQPPGGMKLEKTADGYTITSSKGDVTTVHDKGHYIDLEGEIGPDRKVGEINGAMGRFDNSDGADSHLKRDGTQAANRDEMIEDWKVKPEEDLFNAAGKGGPGETPVDPANPGGPPLTEDQRKQLVEILGQLTKLSKSLADLLLKLLGPDGKGGPVEPQKPAEPKPAEPAPQPAPAEPAPKPGDVNGSLADIMKALKSLLELLEKLMAQLGADKAEPKPADPATPAPLGPLPALPKAA